MKIKNFPFISFFLIIILILILNQKLVSIDDQIIISGFWNKGKDFGKFAYLHILILFPQLFLIWTAKVWAYRTHFFLSLINLSWTLRNYILLSSCFAGICPSLSVFFYLYIFLNFLVFISLLWRK